MRAGSELKTLLASAKMVTAAAVAIGLLGGCCISKHHHGGHDDRHGDNKGRTPHTNAVVFLDDSGGKQEPRIMTNGVVTDAIMVYKGASIKWSGTNDFLLIFPGNKNPKHTGDLEIEVSNHNHEANVIIHPDEQEPGFKYTLIILQSYGTNVIPRSSDPFIIIRP